MLSGMRHCGRIRYLSLALKDRSSGSPSQLQACSFGSAPSSSDPPSRRAHGRGYGSQTRYGIQHCLLSRKLAPRNTSLQQVTGNVSQVQVRRASTVMKAALDHRTDFFQDSEQVNQDQVLIVLNYVLPGFVPQLWDQSGLRICADGGANRLYDEMADILCDEDVWTVRARYLPDAIIGDLDSLRPEVRKFYTGHKVPVIDLAHDQDTSDLHKCINYAKGAKQGLSEKSKLLVVGAVGGRLDHQLSNIHMLYRFKDLRIVLLGKGNLALLLPEGFEHTLYPDRHIEGPMCALIPVGTPVSDVYTTGLRWNLEGRSLQFGELISTSNEIKANQITVRASGPLLWTTELASVNLRSKI